MKSASEIDGKETVFSKTESYTYHRIQGKKKKSSFLDYVRNALVDIITYYAIVDHKHATFDNNKTGPLITEEANHFIPSMQYSVTMKQGHKNTTYD